MKIEEHVPLSEIVTFKVGGAARYVITCTSTEDIEAGVQFAKERNLSLVILGGGSNVLPPDEPYDGVILRIQTQGIREVRRTDTFVEYGVAAGVSWDDFVTYAVQAGLWGIENLAAIPGSVGATPVQNIGAYGMDVSQTIASVTVYDVRSESYEEISHEHMNFGYRDSRFKHEPHLIITEVFFTLRTHSEPRIGYPDLHRAKEEGTPLITPSDIATAIRRIRSHKFPDLSEYGTAGSFFKNPILTHTQFSELSKRYGAIPSFPHPVGVKVPLAYILDHVLALKGYEKRNTFLFGNQPLVLVARRSATANDIEQLAMEIEKKVYDATEIRIEREVTHLTEHEIIFL